MSSAYLRLLIFLLAIFIPACASSVQHFTWCTPHISYKTSTSASLPMLKPLTVWITTNWKTLQEMGIPDPLTCLLRNLNAGQEAAVRTRHGITDWFQIGKGVCQGCILSPSLLAYMQNVSCKILGWMKSELESRLPGEISITSDKLMTPPLWQKVKN